MIDKRLEKINELISIYIKTSKKRGFMKCPASANPDHKNYICFAELIDKYGTMPWWDPYGFVISNFDRVAPKAFFPTMLKTKIALDTFSNYKKAITSQSFSEDKYDVLIQSFKNAKDLIEEKVGSYDTKRFFRDGKIMSQGLSLFLKGMVSPYFCAMNKDFIEELKILESDIRQLINIEELTMKRKLIAGLPVEIKDKLKAITGIDKWM